MSRATRRTRRLLGAISLTAVSTLLLSGCVLIQELQGTTKQQHSPEELIDADLDPSLREFYEQDLEWGACPEEYAVDDKFECATAKAPMVWDDPEAHDPIELALIKLPAKGDSQGALFSNPGGPGGSGIDFVAQTPGFFSTKLRENFDLVSWDPRGVGASSAVKCYDDAGTDEYFYGVPENAAEMSVEELVEYQRNKEIQYGAACLKNTGPLLEYVDTQSTVRDLDLLRALVGDPKLNYFGLSYGSDIGAHYIDTFPERVGRITLDGAVDPTVQGHEVAIDQQKGFAESTRAYLKDCLSSEQCPFEGVGGVDGAVLQIQKLMNDVDATLPKHTDGRVLTSGVMQQAIITAMYDESSWSILSQAFTQWKQNKDASTFFLLSDVYYGRDTEGHYGSNMFDAFTAINCLDTMPETDPQKIREQNKQLLDVMLFKNEQLVAAMEESSEASCANWPVKSRVESMDPVSGAGADPVLVVATSNDPATPLVWAEGLAEQLESATLVVYEGEGHIAYDEDDQCTMDTIDSYFVDGTVPDEERVTCGGS